MTKLWQDVLYEVDGTGKPDEVLHLDRGRSRQDVGVGSFPVPNRIASPKSVLRRLPS